MPWIPLSLERFLCGNHKAIISVSIPLIFLISPFLDSRLGTRREGEFNRLLCHLRQRPHPHRPMLGETPGGLWPCVLGPARSSSYSGRRMGAGFFRAVGHWDRYSDFVRSPSTIFRHLILCRERRLEGWDQWFGAASPLMKWAQDQCPDKWIATRRLGPIITADFPWRSAPRSYFLNTWAQGGGRSLVVLAATYGSGFELDALGPAEPILTGKLTSEIATRATQSNSSLPGAVGHGTATASPVASARIILLHNSQRYWRDAEMTHMYFGAMIKIQLGPCHR